MSIKEKQFYEIFNEFYSPLCNYAFKVVGDKDEAEEIIQGLFIEFWETNKLETVEFMERYLLRSVKFKCLDYLKYKRKKNVVRIIDINDVHSTANVCATKLKLSKESILIASTGVIGEYLPIKKIHSTIPKIISSLSVQGGKHFASAIMTTDTVEKEFSKTGFSSYSIPSTRYGLVTSINR